MQQSTKFLRFFANGALLIIILFFFTGLLGALSSRTDVLASIVSRLLLYSCFALGIVILAAAALSPVSRPRYGIPTPLFIALLSLAAAIAAIALLNLHQPAGLNFLATKSFVTALIFIGAYGLILSAFASKELIRNAIVIAVLAAGTLILTDVVSSFGPAVTGRGAGLYGNPNVACLVVLIGAVGVFRRLTPTAQLPFLTAVAVFLFATLSRSGIVIALAAFAILIAVEWARISAALSSHRRSLPFAAAILIAGIVLLALATPQQYNPAHRITTMPGTIGVESPPLPGATAAPTMPPHCISVEAIVRGLRKNANCPWADKASLEEIDRLDPTRFRFWLNLRAAAAFFDSPWTGVGLDRAFDFRTHNTFLLFAIAYGVLGLLIVPAFAICAIYRLGGWRNALPLLTVLFLASLVSHDLFISHELTAAWVAALATGPNQAASQIPTPN